MKTSSRRLIKTDMFPLALRLQKTSSRRLGQEQYIRLGHMSSRRLQDVFKTSSRRLQDVFKTFWSRPIYSSWPYVFKTSSRRIQDVFKTSSRCLQDVFKTSWSRPIYSSWPYVFKTSSRHLQDVLQRHLQDVFKAYHQVKLFLLTRLREVFNTFLRRSFPKTAIYRGICLGNTTSEKFMVSVQNLQER